MQIRDELEAAAEIKRLERAERERKMRDEAHAIRSAEIGQHHVADKIRHIDTKLQDAPDEVHCGTSVMVQCCP